MLRRICSLMRAWFVHFAKHGWTFQIKVQPMPIRKGAFSALSLLTQLALLIYSSTVLSLRSLSPYKWRKIRASTIFHHLHGLAELFEKNWNSSPVYVVLYNKGSFWQPKREKLLFTPFTAIMHTKWAKQPILAHGSQGNQDCLGLSRKKRVKTPGGGTSEQ